MNAQNIEIRSCEPDDFRAIHELHVQPKAVWGTLRTPYASIEVWRKRLAKPPDGLHFLAACVDGSLIGCLGLWAAAKSPRRRHAGELGIVVHDRWHGKGVGSALVGAATELADRWLNLTRLELTVYTDNTPAIELYRKFGFEIEGTLRKYAFRDGQFVDAYAMARVQDN